MLAIIDYRAGNLTSVRNAFAVLGEEAVVTDDAAAIRRADRVVFPGVGAAASAMANLKALGLADVVREAADSGKPFLGICLGMQILFEHSEEGEMGESGENGERVRGTATLGILPGRVRRFPDVPGFKVPEIGWNSVSFKNWQPATDNPQLPTTLYPLPTEFYFVHSYYAEVCPYTVGFAEYAGVAFTAMVKKGNLWACQFHPEKSGRVGLELLKEWLMTK